MRQQIYFQTFKTLIFSKNKQGLSWAKLSSSWDWSLLQLTCIKLMKKKYKLGLSWAKLSSSCDWSVLQLTYTKLLKKKYY